LVSIDIHVPKEQVIDTVDIFFKKARQRKLSLRFLAWYLLHENIQTGNHDSIEDANTALRLYKKYLEFTDAGIFEQMLNKIYTEGKLTNFKPPNESGSIITNNGNGMSVTMVGENNGTVVNAAIGPLAQLSSTLEESRTGTPPVMRDGGLGVGAQGTTFGNQISSPQPQPAKMRKWPS